MNKKLLNILTALLAACWLTACTNGNESDSAAAQKQGVDHDGDGDHDEAHDHDDDEAIALGQFDIGGVSVVAAQEHGHVEPGKEGHLVVKLSSSDKGATTVRAWIGIEDRTLSSVGKGEYSASHDDYDIHAIAPDPLPVGTKWWVEIEKPDGSRVVGSIPLLRDVK